MRRFVLTSLLFVLSAAAASAQAARFELTPLVGYRLNGPIDITDRDGFVDRTDLQVDEGNFYGLIFDIPLSPSWQLELIANRQQTQLTLDEGLLEPDQNLGDLDLSYYHVGLNYVWGRGQVEPFFGASVGLARIDPKSQRLDPEDRFSAALGGGVKVFFNQNVGLRFEARGYYTDFTTVVDEDDRHSRRDFDKALYQGEGSVGLIFAF